MSGEKHVDSQNTFPKNQQFAPWPQKEGSFPSTIFSGAMFALESVGDLSAKHGFVASLVSKLSIEP